MIRILNQQCSVLNEYVAELRNVEIQNDPLRFRTNLERIGSIIGYELSKELAYEDKEVTTPLGISVDKTLKQQHLDSRTCTGLGCTFNFFIKRGVWQSPPNLFSC